MPRSREKQNSNSKHSSSFLDGVRSAAGRIRDAVLRRGDTDAAERHARSGEESTRDDARMADTRGRKETGVVAEPRRRIVRSDIGIIDEITPQQMRSHAPFDDARDPDVTLEAFEETGPARWRDEDHYTNKSGDPRIGTRGRKYEP